MANIDLKKFTCAGFLISIGIVFGDIGNFRFVIMERFLSFGNELSLRNELVLKLHFLLKHVSLPDEKEYGLDYSSVTVEKAPLIFSPPKNIPLKRDN